MSVTSPLRKALGEKTSANCGPSNFEFVQSLGADHVIDYSGTDFMANLDRFERRHFDDNSSPPLAGRPKRSSSPFRRGLKLPAAPATVGGAEVKAMLAERDARIDDLTKELDRLRKVEAQTADGATSLSRFLTNFPLRLCDLVAPSSVRHFEGAALAFTLLCSDM